MSKTYRELISQKTLHRVQERANRLREFELVQILYSDNELVFKTRSGTPPYKKIWTQVVYIEDLERMLATRPKFNNFEKFLKDAGLKVKCDCEAFLYWGGAYFSWKKGFGLLKETRYPRVRQPYYRGYTCKHIYAVMKSYPFWSKILAKKFLQDYAKRNPVVKPSEEDKLENALDNVDTLHEVNE